MSELLATFQQFLLLSTLVGIVALAILAWLADRITKSIFLRIVDRIVRETSFKFDDVLLEYNVFGRLAHLAPAIAVYYGIRFVQFPEWLSAVSAAGTGADLATDIQRLTSAVMVLIGVSALGAFLTALGKTYATSELAEGRPIEAYTQIAKIAIWVIGSVLFVAELTGRSPLLLLSGIGAITAVLLLIFRDTILSFVASLQITSYDMIRVGDWIEMSQYGADGDVIELTLHTVKVQNWDKTITAIPTHKLIEEPFRNWRGMQESGGRRIKRALYVDMNSIRFLTDDELDHLENFVVLREYVRRKRQELADFNRPFSATPELIPNARRLTNVGTFRAYLVEYLRRHPGINQDMTLLVRQLALGESGLPIEIYTFTKTTNWNEYENVQSDIFDHVLSIAREFGLAVFQKPSGRDIGRLAGGRDASGG